jgi:hydroxyacylglutathione hydrolase
MLTVTPVRAFTDNYLWLIQGLADPSLAAIVDPGDADAVLAALQHSHQKLAAILVTHHHGDHVGGVAELVRRTGARVFAPARERAPAECTPVSGGDTVDLPELGLTFKVLDVPGHTAGHVAYVGHGAVFCGDTLFSVGCGRLFEGTAEQMLASLDALAALPDDTRVFCAHEYTLSNLRFALSVDPDNADLHAWRDQAEALREQDIPTVPTTIGLEKKVNPFLRSRSPAVKRAAEAHAHAVLGSPLAVFAEIRRWKDGFQ